MIAFVLLRVFLILLLVAANAFFAAAEFALVSVRDTRIQQLIDARRIGARTVQKLHRNLDEVVNGVQLGITLISLTLGWVGEPIARPHGGSGASDTFPRLGLRPHDRHRRRLRADHLLARDSGRTGAQVAGSAARRTSRSGRRRARWTSFLPLTRPLLFVMSRAAGSVLAYLRFTQDPPGPDSFSR